jgi:site-specific DNA-methyltransferase (adenine-specific)
MTVSQINNKTICADLFNVIDLVPVEFVDLLIIDPPYNLDKNFNRLKFGEA